MLNLLFGLNCAADTLFPSLGFLLFRRNFEFIVLVCSSSKPNRKVFSRIWLNEQICVADICYKYKKCGLHEYFIFKVLVNSLH